MAVKEKNFLIMLIFVLCGIVIGGLLGELASSVEWLNWLSFGEEFGLQAPIVLDLRILTLTFAFSIKISVASICGIIISILIYRMI